MQHQNSPLYYKRYVDDTFAIFKDDNQKNSFLNKLNIMHNNLEFTKENAVNNKLAFLDVLVHRKEQNHFTKKIYRTTAFIPHIYLLTHIVQSEKINLISCLTYKAMKIFSENI